ncbi:S8 family serine peptidase [Sphingomonas bacterium]|uniref:S8 family serine peptidase n=1 Tax=Sphingomonas bacterium TaxID=1895847 RepID=UPI0015766766|nr:S8 family serine peptidase [Sphingomonas bacterium]
MFDRVVRDRQRSLLQATPVLTASLLLAACGGGGGVNSSGTAAPPTSGTPTPTLTPAPTSTPTPAPTPTPTASAEDQASRAATSIKAEAAYAKGLTGRGVTVAVIDTGVNTTSTEFAGRLSPDSRSFDSLIARCATCAPETVRFALDDVIGHGTETASIAVAARDGTGMHGVAPDATLLALKVSAPDLTGVTATSPIGESDQADPRQVASAIAYAVDRGAFVLSLSVNGSASNQTAVELRTAMDQVSREDRLLVESVSNDVGDQSSAAGTITRDLVGASGENRTSFLFGIRVNPDLTAPSGNGLPGDLADRTLAVMAVQVQAVGKDGQPVTVTGNSFAAPAIAGAAALLKQYWPHLGGRAIARILLDTATDLGTPGADQQYGAGLLNLERALQAQAPASGFAAAGQVLASYSSITVSAPFGGAATANALAGGLSSMTVVDRYGRDYRMAGASAVQVRGSGLLAGGMLPAMVPPWSRASTGSGYASGVVHANLAPSAPVGPWQHIGDRQPAALSFSPAAGQNVTLAANVAVAGARGLAGSPLRGVVGTPVGSSAAWTGSGWSASYSSGRSRDGAVGITTIGMLTPLGVGLELTELLERGQVLGMTAGGSADPQDARTRVATLAAAHELGSWRLGARATLAVTDVQGGGRLRFTGPVTSTAFGVEASRPTLGGLLDLGLSSPLRVQHARASLEVPLAFDLVTGALATGRRDLDLAASARELDLEAGWSGALSAAASLRVGVARAFDAGHAAGATDTAGYLSLTIR